MVYMEASKVVLQGLWNQLSVCVDVHPFCTLTLRILCVLVWQQQHLCLRWQRSSGVTQLSVCREESSHFVALPHKCKRAESRSTAGASG